MEIVETMRSFRMRDLSKHFKQRGKPREMWTWKQVRQGERVTARYNYIY